MVVFAEIIGAVFGLAIAGLIVGAIIRAVYNKKHSNSMKLGKAWLIGIGIWAVLFVLAQVIGRAIINK